MPEAIRIRENINESVLYENEWIFHGIYYRGFFFMRIMNVSKFRVILSFFFLLVICQAFNRYIRRWLIENNFMLSLCDIFYAHPCFPQECPPSPFPQKFLITSSHLDNASL